MKKKNLKWIFLRLVNHSTGAMFCLVKQIISVKLPKMFVRLFFYSLIVMIELVCFFALFSTGVFLSIGDKRAEVTTNERWKWKKAPWFYLMIKCVSFVAPHCPLYQFRIKLSSTLTHSHFTRGCCCLFNPTAYCNWPPFVHVSFTVPIETNSLCSSLSL